MQTQTLDEFIAACKAQAPSADMVVFQCPMCHALQTAQDLVAAGAGDDFDAVERYLGFSCIGRFTGAGPARRQKDGRGCDWTLGGLFRMHQLEVVTPDGKAHPRFELASQALANTHRAAGGFFKGTKAARASR